MGKIVTNALNVIQVKSTGGDSHLGGRDIDQEIVSFIKNKFKIGNLF